MDPQEQVRKHILCVLCCYPYRIFLCQRQINLTNLLEVKRY